MARSLGVIVVSLLGRSSCVATQQAGEPTILNVDYDVPSVGADAVAADVQHSAAIEAELAMTSADPHGRRSVGFAGLGLHSGDVPLDDTQIVVHVAAPPMGTAEAASLVGNALSQLANLSALTQRQRSQETRALRGAKFLLQHSASSVSDEALRKVGATDAPASSRATLVDGIGGHIAELTSKVDAGGRVAKIALEHLCVLAATPSVRDVIASAGAARAAATLLQRPSTDEAIRALAGSLLTLLSGMPIAAEQSNIVTGAGEHVEVVLPRPSRVYGPDSFAMQLSAGVPPSAISS